MKYTVRKDQNKNNLLSEGNSYIQKIEEKLKDEMNNFCVECGEENPEYVSINNGIFICRDCVQIHLKFPTIISRVKKNNIKTLTLNEIQYLLCGGNRALLNFICNEYPKLAELPSNILYRTQAMFYYRQNLQYIINGSIAPEKPSIKSAYKIQNTFDEANINYNNDIIKLNNKNEIYNNTISDTRNMCGNKSLFYRTGYNFRRGAKECNNTINNLALNNCDNYFINRSKQINFQNNNNIIIGNQLEYINEIDNVQKYKRFSKDFHTNLNSEKNNKYNSNNNNNKNKNILMNNVNNDIYIRPKLILSHNVSKHKNNNNNSRKKSFDRNNKKYFYSKINNIFREPKTIDFIQLNFSKENNHNNGEKRKMNNNLSIEIYKNSKKLEKKNIKYMHKSFSQKSYYNNNSSNNNNKNNKFNINIQTENHYIPSKQANIKYNNNNHQKICITNNEEIQIVPNINSINFHKNNNNEKNLTEDNICSIEYNPIKINIKVNKKDKNDNKEKKVKKDIRKDKIVLTNKTKLELRKNENIKKIITKCSKNRTLLRKKEFKSFYFEENKDNNNRNEKENSKINKNVNSIKKIYKNSSQENVGRQSNKNLQLQIKQNNECNDKKNISIRNRYKIKFKNK